MPCINITLNNNTEIPGTNWKYYTSREALCRTNYPSNMQKTIHVSNMGRVRCTILRLPDMKLLSEQTKRCSGPATLKARIQEFADFVPTAENQGKLP